MLTRPFRRHIAESRHANASGQTTFTVDISVRSISRYVRKDDQIWNILESGSRRWRRLVERHVENDAGQMPVLEGGCERRVVSEAPRVHVEDAALCFNSANSGGHQPGRRQCERTGQDQNVRRVALFWRGRCRCHAVSALRRSPAHLFGQFTTVLNEGLHGRTNGAILDS